MLIFFISDEPYSIAMLEAALINSISMHLGCNGGKLTAEDHEILFKLHPKDTSGTCHVPYPKQARMQKHSPWRRHCEHQFERGTYVLHSVQIIQIQAKLTCSFATAFHMYVKPLSINLYIPTNLSIHLYIYLCVYLHIHIDMLKYR